MQRWIYLFNLVGNVSNVFGSAAISCFALSAPNFDPPMCRRFNHVIVVSHVKSSLLVSKIDNCTRFVSVAMWGLQLDTPVASTRRFVSPPSSDNERVRPSKCSSRSLVIRAMSSSASGPNPLFDTKYKQVRCGSSLMTLASLLLNVWW